MKLIVIGCGRVGSTIAKRFASEGWDVTAVDENESALSRLGENWTGGFVRGHGKDNLVPRAARTEAADAPAVSADGGHTNPRIGPGDPKRFSTHRPLRPALHSVP